MTTKQREHRAAVENAREEVLEAARNRSKLLFDFAGEAIPEWAKDHEDELKALVTYHAETGAGVAFDMLTASGDWGDKEAR